MTEPSGMLSVRTLVSASGSNDRAPRSTRTVDAMIMPTPARAMMTMPPPLAAHPTDKR
jgi:hypothetical protein